MNNVFVSSVAFQQQDFNSIVQLATNNKWAVEFSAGLTNDESSEMAFLNATIIRMPHNYYLADEPPFVMNLASADEAIRTRSLNHCKRMLELAKKVNAPFYAAHAGFCFDPKPEELGRKISYSGDIDREKHMLLFLQSIRKILETADFIEIDFYIENNVLAKFNYENTTVNPLLCAEHNDIKRVFTEIRHKRFGLLLDTAHLKVSAQTLSLNAEDEWMKILPFVKAFHHSDNNGLVDNNQKLDNNYWCQDLMNSPEMAGMIHVIEVKNISEEDIMGQIQFVNQILFK